MTDVALEPAGRQTLPLVANLLSLYMHDMSEIFPVRIGADGRFHYDALERYGSGSETHRAFVIRADAAPAGVALARRGSTVVEDAGAWDVAEFFVLRGLRRSGVGRRAAFLLWDRLPGSWIVRVSEGNAAGLAFWPALVAAYTAGAFVPSVRPGSPHPWRVFAFASRATAPNVG